MVGGSKIGSWPWRKILRWRNEGHQQKATKTVAVIKAMCTQPRWKTCFCQSSAPRAGRQTPFNQQRFHQNFVGDQGHDVLFGAYELGCSLDVLWVNPGIEHTFTTCSAIFPGKETIEAMSYDSKWLTTQILTVAKRREWGNDPIHTYYNHSIHPFPAFSTSKNSMVYFERPSNWFTRICYLKLG